MVNDMNDNDDERQRIDDARSHWADQLQDMDGRPQWTKELERRRGGGFAPSSPAANSPPVARPPASHAESGWAGEKFGSRRAMNQTSGVVGSGSVGIGMGGADRGAGPSQAMDTASTVPSSPLPSRVASRLETLMRLRRSVGAEAFDADRAVRHSWRTSGPALPKQDAGTELDEGEDVVERDDDSHLGRPYTGEGTDAFDQFGMRETVRLPRKGSPRIERGIRFQRNLTRVEAMKAEELAYGPATAAEADEAYLAATNSQRLGDDDTRGDWHVAVKCPGHGAWGTCGHPNNIVLDEGDRSYREALLAGIGAAKELPDEARADALSAAFDEYRAWAASVTEACPACALRTANAARFDAKLVA